MFCVKTKETTKEMITTNITKESKHKNGLAGGVLPRPPRGRAWTLEGIVIIIISVIVTVITIINIIVIMCIIITISVIIINIIIIIIIIISSSSSSSSFVSINNSALFVWLLVLWFIVYSW